ncbi:outer membrane beta-barrel protein [Aurantimonas sp. VKM B-3413]|uniref:outer membrane beta-barrel protein n=1 Tax=Aurantimonas sp. VKM B-3413 TaxID=2779401 RepID=UPI001E5BC084|nr:outer membrane beta-barrel protein [Aurantimonas sp. VKM B-3413]MCB8839571.1 outer membrane beta-barrel protein [Aurantimonas sp. VKM B-3413]
MTLSRRERLSAGVVAALLALGPAAATGAGAQTLRLPDLRTERDITDSRTLTQQRREPMDSNTRIQAPRPQGEPNAPDAAGNDLANGPDARDMSAAGQDDGAAPGDARSAPKPRSFDLFAGPETNQPAVLGGSATPSPNTPFPATGRRQGADGEARDGKPKDQGSSPSRPAKPVRPAGPAGGPARQRVTANGLPAQPNPPLAGGVADETSSADSPLRNVRPTQAIDRILRPRRKAEDPFGPVGMRAGSFILYPQLIQTLGISSNLEAKAHGKSGVFSETTVSARLISDWSLHQAEINSSLSYRRNFAGTVKEDPSAAIDGRLRLDLSHDTVATLRGAIDYQREDADDIDDGLSSTTRADVFSGSASAQLTHTFEPLILSGTITAARKSYSGLPGQRASDDYTTLTTALRTGYDLSPALKPFVEASIGRRLFDEDYRLPDGSLDRDSWIPALRTGVELSLTEKLTGEIAVGYAWNRPDDARSARAAAPTIDASLVWSAQRGTDVTLSAKTTFEPETSGQSTTTTYVGALGLRHALTARTDLTAAFRAEYKDSSLASNDETLLTGEAGFTYWINRTMAVTGLYSHQEDLSQVKDADYRVDTISLGIKLQR